MTNIEWTNESWNPTIGCSRTECMTLYCYANKQAIRLKRMGLEDYQLPNPFEPRFVESRLNKPFKWRKPRMVFVNSMGDLFDQHISELDILRVINVIKKNPKHIFQVLTKQAHRAVEVLKWVALPKNLWLGVTQDGKTTQFIDVEVLALLKPQVLFVSCEPLLGPIHTHILDFVDWLIIGAQTNPDLQPKREWVETLINATEHLGVPLFIKDNLEGFEHVREWPVQRKDENNDM